MGINTRKIALDAVQRIFDGGYSNLIINQILKDSDISARDKSFITALVYGVTERKITLDYIIETVSGRALEKIDPLALGALRIGIYQLLYMDKVPESAAVNESVKIIKSSKKGYLAGFVNAVLRNVQRKHDALIPDGTNDTVQELSVAYSCSADIVQMLAHDYGFEITRAFLETALGASGVTVRVNTLKTSEDELILSFEQDGICAEKTTIKNVLNIKNQRSLENDKRFKAGLFHVQDISSAICAEAVSPKRRDRILDICAAPGGKSFTMAQIAEDDCEMLSCDIHPHRVELIKNGCNRLGLKSIKPLVLDASIAHDELGSFDKILCDVPCSGVGVIGRKPEIKYHTAESFNDLPALQIRILNNAARLLKKGGRLVYSTCTVLKRENEEVFQKFIKNNNNFKAVSCKTYLPHIDNTDGFFVAVAEKN